MNKSNAAQYLPFVIALTEGRTIQFDQHGNDKWADRDDISFWEGPEHYRIKPEPMEFFAIANDDKTDILSGVFNTRKGAENHIEKNEWKHYKTIIHVREIE